MTNEGSYVALGLKVWKAQLDRADKLFGGLSSEEVLREIAQGRNRLLYLWGHLTAMHDAMLPLLGLGDRFHPEFDVAFVSNPDKSQAAIPSHEQVRQVWKTVNGELWKGFEKMSWSDWLQRHTAVSEEDFAKDASRNRFVWLANCCFAHISLGFPFLLRFCDEQSGHSVACTIRTWSRRTLRWMVGQSMAYHSAASLEIAPTAVAVVICLTS